MKRIVEAVQVTGTRNQVAAAADAAANRPSIDASNQRRFRERKSISALGFIDKAAGTSGVPRPFTPFTCGWWAWTRSIGTSGALDDWLSGPGPADASVLSYSEYAMGGSPKA